MKKQELTVGYSLKETAYLLLAFTVFMVCPLYLINLPDEDAGTIALTATAITLNNLQIQIASIVSQNLSAWIKELLNWMNFSPF